MINRRAAASLCSVALLAGCVNVDVRQHVRASDYTQEVKRVAVLMPGDDAFGTGFAQRFPATFREAIQSQLAACGVASVVSQLEPMELDGPAKARAAVTAFRPGNILVVQHTKRFLINGGDLSETYVFTLQDLAQKRDVWKGELDVRANSQLFVDRSRAGTILASKLVQQMAADDILRACPPPEGRVGQDR